MFGKQRAGQSQVYPDFCHACMNKNPDMPETIVRMHASEMERSEIEPWEGNRAPAAESYMQVSAFTAEIRAQ